MPRALISRAVESTLNLHGRPGEYISIAIVSDESIRTWNSRYRGLDEPTDVLTFPSGDVPGAPLGDVAISIEYAERQARVRRGSLSSELAYLAIHGTLHLLGFDDETERDRAAMMGEMHRAGIAAGLPPDPTWASVLHGGAE